jgi:hypothetical protein
MAVACSKRLLFTLFQGGDSALQDALVFEEVAQLLHAALRLFARPLQALDQYLNRRL